MPVMSRARAAYQATSNQRSWREQEADVFRRTVGALKSAQSADLLTQVRALSDNRRLWITVGDLVRDPANGLPMQLRAAIASISLAVQREMAASQPDFGFLIAINEDIIAGLSGSP